MRLTPIFLTISALATGLLVAGWADPAPAVTGARHSGTVTAVDPKSGTLVVQELAEGGKARALHLRISPHVRLLHSERLPLAEIRDFGRSFKETPITLTDIRLGDFVVVEFEGEDPQAVASVTVTLPVEGH